MERALVDLNHFIVTEKITLTWRELDAFVSSPSYMSLYAEDCAKNCSLLKLFLKLRVALAAVKAHGEDVQPEKRPERATERTREGECERRTFRKLEEVDADYPEPDHIAAIIDACYKYETKETLTEILGSLLHDASLSSHSDQTPKSKPESFHRTFGVNIATVLRAFPQHKSDNVVTLIGALKHHCTIGVNECQEILAECDSESSMLDFLNPLSECLFRVPGVTLPKTLTIAEDFADDDLRQRALLMLVDANFRVRKEQQEPAFVRTDPNCWDLGTTWEEARLIFESRFPPMLPLLSELQTTPAPTLEKDFAFALEKSGEERQKPKLKVKPKPTKPKLTRVSKASEKSKSKESKKAKEAKKRAQKLEEAKLLQEIRAALEVRKRELLSDSLTLKEKLTKRYEQAVRQLKAEYQEDMRQLDDTYAEAQAFYEAASSSLETSNSQPPKTSGDLLPDLLPDSVPDPATPNDISITGEENQRKRKRSKAVERGQTKCENSENQKGKRRKLRKIRKIRKIRLSNSRMGKLRRLHSMASERAPQLEIKLEPVSGLLWQSGCIRVTNIPNASEKAAHENVTSYVSVRPEDRPSFLDLANYAPTSESWLLTCSGLVEEGHILPIPPSDKPAVVKLLDELFEGEYLETALYTSLLGGGKERSNE